MKTTDFSGHLTLFLAEYLPHHKNASRNTIASYRDTFKLLIRYCQEEKNIKAEKLTMSQLTNKLIEDFLEYLENDRRCSISSRNQRLAAIHSFFRYAQYEEPASLMHFQKVISIPVKKSPKISVPHLTPADIKILLEQPDRITLKGRRDLTLLCTLYDSGCRVQELVDLKVKDVILDAQPVIVLTGKGNKTRRVPIMNNSVLLLKTYIQEQNLDKSWKSDYPLFENNQHHKLTKEGISYILMKYVAKARESSQSIPAKVSPHMLRHSKAMHLLQAGVALIYIRDFLGHNDIRTTEIYAKCDTESKRSAIESAYHDLIGSNLPDWNRDADLIEWLSKL